MDHVIKLKENEKKEKYLDLARESKTPVKRESDGDTNCNWCSWYSHQKTGTESRGVGNNRMNKDHLNYSIIEKGQNTEKSPGDLKRLAVTQALAKGH